jgi:hypothetical protein
MKYWKVTVATWGTAYLRGDEEHAEEWRQHKAVWEQSPASKVEIKPSEVPVGQRVLTL